MEEPTHTPGEWNHTKEVDTITAEDISFWNGTPIPREDIQEIKNCNFTDDDKRAFMEFCDYILDANDQEGSEIEEFYVDGQSLFDMWMMAGDEEREEHYTRTGLDPPPDRGSVFFAPPSATSAFN